MIRKLSEAGHLTVRLAYNLFTQKPKSEKEDFLNWTKTSKYKQGDDYFRHNGAGEMLVFSAADFEDFRQPRPDMPPEIGGMSGRGCRKSSKSAAEKTSISPAPVPEVVVPLFVLGRLGPVKEIFFFGLRFLSEKIIGKPDGGCPASLSLRITS